ncbi:2OG-Fe dioxygenase family protein [Streptomyces xanthochromogenes]|uniref:2OG-Fe dioxygenase family protein n=1 Tax=Streptomyces xanthochromogenes TaxID=67384 RepID=UPI001963F870
MYDFTLSDAMSEIMEIKAQYISERSVFVEGARMIPLLKALGATDVDLERIKLVSDDLPKDPTLPFRESRNGRFCFDFENSRVYRLEAQPFALSAEEDFVRHDSGQTRVFEEVGDNLQLNTALQALLVFKSLVFHGVATAHRPKLDYNSPGWICTLFNLRTISTPELQGEPALEGVHSDGVDHTMTTFLGSQNMTPGSAVTFLHDMREKNATRWNETDPELVLGERGHRHFLDTLMVVDHERKHSLSPVEAVDTTRTATRDMLIFFTRKPVLEGHISHPYDSLTAHERLPMTVELPQLQEKVLADAGAFVAQGALR